MHSSSRKLALLALREWREGRIFADTIIHQLLARSSLRGADRGFATELFYGVLRNLTLLDFWIRELRAATLDDDSRDLLRLGLYQFFLLRMPGHAAVFETVELAGKRNRGLVNGVLRTATRQEGELQKAADGQPLHVRTSHPEFLIMRWKTAFGIAATEQLCHWNNQPALLYARVNQLRLTSAEFQAQHPAATPLAGRPNFFSLTEVPLRALEAGECYLQDPSTSVACELLDPKPGETVLDACAAPGGKSGLLGELMQNAGQLWACDREPARTDTLRANLDRLGLTNAQVRVEDWTAKKLPAISFDRILLDAPCSNTGVMRRRVDVKWRLAPNDFRRMPNEQLALLRALVPRLKVGGTLVYSTCSIEAEENEGLVAEALRQLPELRLVETITVQPFRDGFDGAFAAKLVRDS